MGDARLRSRVRSLFYSQQKRAQEKRDKNGRIRKRGYLLPFDFPQFHDWFLAQFDGKTGIARCQFCRVPIDPFNCAIDHSMPLSRGGSPDLANLEAVCEKCNYVKSRLTADEFRAFLGQLELLARQFGNECVIDITSRLEKAVKLAASARFNISRQGARAAEREPEKEVF